MKNLGRAIAALLALLLFCVAPAAAKELPFNNGWQFTRIDGSAPDHPPSDARWSNVSLPHTPRIEPRVVNDQWQGVAFYSKRFEAPAGWQGKVVLLRFEGAMNVA